MDISVIIPVLNEEKVIERNLRDLNKYLITETIVSDGGSNDATVVIAGSYAKVVHSKPGRGAQMNFGAKAAASDILLFLHADTTLPDQWRDRILSSMADDGVVGGAFSLSIDSDRLSHRIIAATANLRSRLTKLPYGDQGIFVKRSVFEKIGGFKDIQIMEDVDLMRRLKKSGKVVILDDKVKTSARRWEKEGVAYTTIRNWLLLTLYFMGVTPERLYKLYNAVR
ncbi:MAG: TIGR04283 family arsenosugar biosynthesis glycosyltransferase [Deltaproteobacteria bacterium]|nr:TIGR04283 family arsenosugar biosynthesis glycosyltransferase [Deltaproteobacteria bacterium]